MQHAICPDCGTEFSGANASMQYDSHMNQEHRPRQDADSSLELEESLQKVKDALRITSMDTLGRIGMKDRVIWTATGSWSGSQSITIGDLQALVKIIEMGRGG